MKNTIQFTTIATAAMGCVLSSCVYHSNPVPEMPYNPRQRPVVQQPVVQQPIAQQAPYAPAAPWTPAVQQPTVATTAVQPPVVSTVTPPSSSTPTDPKLITNTGPIPVAMRVEGDPIRVYNPLDTTKTIRIIDPKTGKVHPSGKVLKVKGTNFKFIVP